MFKKRYTRMLAAVAMLAGLTLAGGRVLAADAGSADKQQKLIAVLQSDAPKSEKAITCKQLAIFGGKEAVPALAAMLPDKELSSWARIALEAIPGPEADEALRQALDKTQGRTLVGVINSIAYRRDAKAVDGLIVKMKDADAEVASSAAVALGKIGGDQAAKTLVPALTAAPAAVRSAVAEGCILCAERFIVAGNQGEAVKLYDTVRATDLPKQRVLEATRGAILARQAAGIPLLVELLKSSDKAMFAIAMRTAREMAFPEVTDVLVAEKGKMTPDRQALVLFAMADRGDAKALPAVLESAKSGPTSVRIVAAGVLERLGNVSCVPVLLDAASGDDAALSQAAKVSLARLGGKEVDADLLARLQKSSGKMRQVLIELAEQRRIDGSMAVFAQCAEDADPGVRAAALEAIGANGEDKHAADLVKVLVSKGAKERPDIEKALMAICSRWTTACVSYLAPLSKSDDSANRMVALHALVCCGGPDALASVKAALDDKDQSVGDEAVRTLSTWPNRWPEDIAVTDVLLDLAKNGKTASHKVLAVRGYLQFIQSAKKLGAGQRLSRVNDVLPSVTRPEEKRLAISALAAINSGGALDVLVTCAADATTSEEACSAIVTMLGKNVPGATKPQRQKALQTAVDKSKSEATKTKAQDMLKQIR